MALVRWGRAHWAVSYLEHARQFAGEARVRAVPALYRGPCRIDQTVRPCPMLGGSCMLDGFCRALDAMALQ